MLLYCLLLFLLLFLPPTLGRSAEPGCVTRVDQSKEEEEELDKSKDCSLTSLTSWALAMPTAMTPLPNFSVLTAAPKRRHLPRRCPRAHEGKTRLGHRPHSGVESLTAGRHHHPTEKQHRSKQAAEITGWSRKLNQENGWETAIPVEGRAWVSAKTGRMYCPLVGALLPTWVLAGLTLACREGCGGKGTSKVFACPVVKHTIERTPIPRAPVGFRYHKRNARHGNRSLGNCLLTCPCRLA